MRWKGCSLTKINKAMKELGNTLAQVKQQFSDADPRIAARKWFDEHSPYTPYAREIRPIEAGHGSKTGLTLEEFAAQCLWYEHMRLLPLISEHEGRKHFRRTYLAIRRGDVGLCPPSAWTAIVKRWYSEK